MQKIASYIFALSSKKAAIYLVLCPILSFFIYVVFSIRSKNFQTIDSFTLIGFITSAVLISGVVVLWLYWMKTVVFSVNKNIFHLPLKWFHLAFAILWFYMLFNIVSGTEPTSLYIIRASSEFINTMGLVIAYPLLCYYSAMVVF